MRTALLLVFLGLTDIASAINNTVNKTIETPQNALNFIGLLFLVFMVMDVIDFIKDKK